MKTVKEIKEYLSDNRRGPIEKQQDLNLFLIDCIIGITEHLEGCGMEPVSDYLLMQAEIDRARREAMIEALRWVLDEGHAIRKVAVTSAITRLENGGDL